MTAYNRTPIGKCQHCGEDVRDGTSPTGLVHAATGRARCDGLPMTIWANRRNHGDFPMAVIS